MSIIEILETVKETAPKVAGVGIILGGVVVGARLVSETPRDAVGASVQVDGDVLVNDCQPGGKGEYNSYVVNAGADVNFGRTTIRIGEDGKLVTTGETVRYDTLPPEYRALNNQLLYIKGDYLGQGQDQVKALVIQQAGAQYRMALRACAAVSEGDWNDGSKITTIGDTIFDRRVLDAQAVVNTRPTVSCRSYLGGDLHTMYYQLLDGSKTSDNPVDLGCSVAGSGVLTTTNTVDLMGKPASGGDLKGSGSEKTGVVACPDKVLPGSNYFRLKSGNTVVDAGVLKYGMKVNKNPVDVVYKNNREKACVGVTSQGVTLRFLLAADGTILRR